MKKEVKVLLHEIADFWFEGCTQPELEDPLDEIRQWRTLGCEAKEDEESDRNKIRLACFCNIK